MATRQISETLVDIQKYPRTMKRWYDNRDAISPIFKFSKDVRMVIYTINAIESLNSTYRQLNSQRSVDFLDRHLFDDGHHVGVSLHHVVNIHRLKSISLRHSRNFLAAFSSSYQVIHHRCFAKKTALCPGDQLAIIIAL